MYQNYNYYPQQTQLPTQTQQQIPYYQQRSAINITGLKGRPVSSIEEAKASAVDFDGTIFYFPDLANKCIYTKQINVDGSATLNIYELKQIPMKEQEPSANLFVTREEFDSVIGQLKSALSPQQQTARPTTAKPELKSF